MANLVRDIPSVLYGTQEDYRRLFYSSPDIALTMQVTIGPGFGVLKAGTLISRNDSAAGNFGKYVPYDMVACTGVEPCPGRSYLVAEGAASVYAYITLTDSYKYVVADDLFGIDSDASAVDLGAIVAIDRTTYPHMAKITCTSQLTTALNVAKFAYLYIEGSDTADGILMNTVDTGTGSTAQGAVANMIVSNAVVYRAAITNVDTYAVTDLSLTPIIATASQYFILK